VIIPPFSIVILCKLLISANTFADGSLLNKNDIAMEIFMLSVISYVLAFISMLPAAFVTDLFVKLCRCQNAPSQGLD